MSECIRDGKTTGDGYALCYSCGEDLEYDLAEVAGVLDDLGAVVARKAKGAPSVGGGGSGENPLPYDSDAMTKGRELVALLASWVLNVADETGDDCPTADAGKMSDWLRSHIDQIRHQDWGLDMRYEVREALNACRRASDRATERIDVGECGSRTDDNGSCMERITAHKDQTLAECRACGTAWDVKDRQRSAILSAWDHLDTMPTILRALKSYDIHIKPKDAENWVRLNHLAPAIAATEKVKLYRVSDVYEVHTRMAQRRNKTKAA